MTRSGCHLSFFFRAQGSFGRRLPQFGASKRTPSGSRVAQIQHKTVFNNKCEPCLLCGIFGARSSSGTTTPQGCGMSLLWVPRGHVALASAVVEGTLTQCGPSNDPCNSCEFEDLHDQRLSTSMPILKEERNLNPHSTAQSPIPPSGPTSFTPTSHTGAPQI